jgi:hypothetical protein
MLKNCFTLTFLLLSFTFSCLIIVPNTVQAQTTAFVQAPKLSFAKAQHDFGDMKQGQKSSFIFQFTNDGNAPLLISKVATTCGCTATSWPEQPIEPGKTGEIHIVFDSRGKMGIQNKIVTIFSNAENPQTRLRVMANVLP